MNNTYDTDSEHDSDFPQRRSTLKVTMTFEGNADDVREAIYGRQEELVQKIQEIQKLRDKLYDVERNLEDALADSKASTKACDEWYKKYDQESDKVYNLTSQNRELERKLTASNEANAKLRAALAAATGQSVESVSVSHPTRSNFTGGSESPNYPYALLVGDRESVKKQALDCFVNDSRQESNIQNQESNIKLQAIKKMRDRTELGLKEAKDLIEWAMGVGEFASR